MTRITFSKYFLTGNLKGLTVRGGFDVPTKLAHKRSLELQAVNVLNPGRELGTGARYYIYNVGTVTA